jgi:hypothetical protein
MEREIIYFIYEKILLFVAQVLHLIDIMKQIKQESEMEINCVKKLLVMMQMHYTYAL